VRGRWILALAIGLPVASVVAVAVLLISYDGRRDIDLGGWVGAEDSWTRSMMPGARWATDELCGSGVPCMQAVTSETLTMYRFADRDDAVAAAESFGADGYLTGWIAVRYEPGGLSPGEREDFEYGISCINTWVGEAGQDC
jgi:hypothetical protein